MVPFFLGKPEEKSKKSTGKRGQEFQRKTRRGDVTITDFGGKKKATVDSGQTIKMKNMDDKQITSRLNDFSN